MVERRRGKFIVLDGVDGSGKGTQVKLLAEYIFDKEKSRHLFLTREPFISKYYQKIRDILRQSKNPAANAEKLTKLFVADRKAHAKIIQYLLDAGIDVISDRYKYSTLAYQQTQGVAFKKLIEIHKEILIPDIAILIDVPVNVALRRIALDSGRSHKEVFETKDFQEMLRQNFLKLPKQLTDEKIIVVNGNSSVKKVFDSIRTEIDKILSA
jgi:dTMP kinase